MMRGLSCWSLFLVLSCILSAYAEQGDINTAAQGDNTAEMMCDISPRMTVKRGILGKKTDYDFIVVAGRDCLDYYDTANQISTPPEIDIDTHCMCPPAHPSCSTAKDQCQDTYTYGQYKGYNVPVADAEKFDPAPNLG